MPNKKVNVYYEATPNPQSMKFVFDTKIGEESLQIDEAAQATRSPLASKLFGFPWMDSVFIGPQFVTITKQDWVDWDILADPLSKLLEEHIELNEPVILPEVQSPSVDENDSPTVQQIKAVIDQEIRPAVAMDGGDIVFHSFDQGVVYIYMRGACSGCPSATLTLKQGIETRLKEAIPEINEVVAL